MIIGVDQSLTSTGVAILVDELIVDSFIIKSAPNVIELSKKILKTEDKFNEILHDHPTVISGLVFWDREKDSVATSKPKAGMFKYEKKALKITPELRIRIILMAFHDRVSAAEKKYGKASLIINETPAISASGQVVTLGQLLGSFQGYGFVRGIKAVAISPLTLKSFAGVKGKDKNLMEEALLTIDREYVANIDDAKKDDIVDAIHLARYAEAKKIGEVRK